jgi:hypothetical protein
MILRCPANGGHLYEVLGEMDLPFLEMDIVVCPEHQDDYSE